VKRETCPHCFGTVHVNDYTREQLRTRILQKIIKFNFMQGNHLIEILVLEGYRAIDIMNETSKLYDDKMIGVNEENCWVVRTSDEDTT
jgi:hypothetical protein